MLSNDIKKQLRDFFSIKNISQSKLKEGFHDVNMYYDYLLAKREKIEQDKKIEIEQLEKENKKKLRNKLKKLRKKINKKVKQFSDSSDSDDTDDENEQVKPYIFFTKSLQTRFDENLYLIGLLNNYYDNNINYRNYLLKNGYEKIKITKTLHRGFTDEIHFNGYFYSGDDVKISGCIHFYVEDDVIKKLSMIVEIG